jgi:predicted DNA-binding transcriptional regulator AlpA
MPSQQPQVVPIGTPENLLTAEDLAHWLQVSPRQVYELSRNRSQVRGRHPLPSIKIHKKMLRFKRSEVEQWLERCSQAGAN